MNNVLGLFVLSEASHLHSNDTMNWSDAMNFCSKKGMVLKKSDLGLADDLVAIGKFWTRIYKKESDLIYLYGCLSANDVRISENMTINRCIKECLHKTPHFFVKHYNGCSCIFDSIPKLQQECDLLQSPLVFRTIGNLAKTNSCEQIVCHERKAKLDHVNCDQKANVICGHEVISGNFTWEGAAKKCNNTRGILNFELNKICSKDTTTYKDRYWFGFGTVEYTDEYNKLNGVSYVNPKECQICGKGCRFVPCKETRIAACEDDVSLAHINATTTKNKTGDLSGLSEEDADDKVTIYCVSILLPALIFSFLCFIYLRCRRQKRQTLENTSGIYNDTPTEHMALTTAVYELADNSKLDFSDRNNAVIETTDTNTVKEPRDTDGSISGETKLTGTYTREDVYNHLWEKPADSSPEQENIYNQCNSEKEEVSNYGVSIGPHSDSAMATSDYDQVILVSATVETSI